MPVFFQPWWLDAACGGAENWFPFVHSQKELIWPMYFKKKGFVRYVTMPPLTPQLGYWPPNEHIEGADIQGLLKKCSPLLYWIQHLEGAITSTRVLETIGCTLSDRFAYHIPSIGDILTLLASLDPKARNNIKRSQRLLTLREEEDGRVLQYLIERSLHRHALKNQLTVPQLNRIMAAAYTAKQGLVLSARDSENRVHAAALFVWDHECTYYLTAGMDERVPQVGAPRWLIWNGIQTAAAAGRRFDFCGGMTPSVGLVYSTMGGIKKPYLRATYYPSNWVKKGVLLLKKWYAPKDSTHH